MSPSQLLTELERRGVTLHVDGDRLRYCAPKGILTDEIRDEIARHKSALLAMLKKSADSAGRFSHCAEGMTLRQFGISGQILRVRSRLLGEDVWWIATDELRPSLPDTNLVAYTALELSQLVSISPEDLINIHRIKKTFDGRIEN